MCCNVKLMLHNLLRLNQAVAIPEVALLMKFKAMDHCVQNETMSPNKLNIKIVNSKQVGLVSDNNRTPFLVFSYEFASLIRKFRTLKVK